MNAKHLFAAALGIAAVTAQVCASEILSTGTFTGTPATKLFVNVMVSRN